MLGLATYLLSAQLWTVAALVTGLFYQQSGWLAHDFAHNQVRARSWQPSGTPGQLSPRFHMAKYLPPSEGRFQALRRQLACGKGHWRGS